MQGLWRRIAGLLLVTVASAVSGAQALAFPAAQAVPVHLHPAGCHSPEPAAPAPPSPTSYQCCVNGHHAAIPNASFTLRSMSAQLCSLNRCDGLRLDFVSLPYPATVFAPSDSPPGAAPLRI